jgi:serine/threonine protein kinase
VDRATAAAGLGLDLEDATTSVARRVRRAGPYRLLQLLGRGGMAEVYRAERAPGVPGLGPATCVVKTIRGELAQSPELARMFADEIKVMHLLQHPNIVRTYDHGLAGGTLYLAMELLDGLSLARLVRSLAHAGLRLPLRLAAHIGAEIAEALAYAHAIRDAHGRCLGLVHRDVSPGNIMLLTDGQTKLVDFGIAKMSATVGARARRAIGATTTPLVVKGKPNYMAPEQLLGRPIDARADLFSLGVVLWELLTWRPLFNRPTTQELAAVLLAGDIEPPSALCPEVPRALESIVLRALDRDPGRRPESAGELARELRRFAPPPDQARHELGQVVRELREHRVETPRRPQARVRPPEISSRAPAIQPPPALRAPPARLKVLLWTVAIAALAFLGGVKWAGRQQAQPAVVAPERARSFQEGPRARIQPLPRKINNLNAPETSHR